MIIGQRIRGLVMDVMRNAATRWFPKSNLVRTLYHKTRNWYEGGWPLLSGDSSYVPQIVQDARWDQNFITRREMLRRMRYWEENSGIVEAILSVGETYTVGPMGLPICWHPTDDSMDDDDPWFESAEQVTQEWFNHCEWGGASMATLLQIAFRRQKCDGDVLVLPTHRRGPLTLANGRVINVNQPALQIVEGHRIESPFNTWTQENQNRMDGVEYEIVEVDGRPMMRRIGYWVRSGFGEFETNSSWVLVPDEVCWYLRNQQRANQPRAVSDFYSVVKDITRLEDMLDMEMRAQNTQSDISVIQETASGQINPLNDPRIRQLNALRGITAPNEPGNEGLTKLSQFYKQAYGGRWMTVKNGEKTTLVAPTRPSDSTLNLFEFLVNKICSGTKAPRGLIIQKISGNSAKTQGTDARAELDNADNYFRKDFAKWRDFVIKAATWHMEWAIANDSRVADPPANWRSCAHVEQPEACNVDVSYNAQSDTMQLASGQTNYHRLYARRGLSWRRELRQLAREQKKIEEWGVKTTLPALLPGQVELTGEEAPAGEKKEPTEKT